MAYSWVVVGFWDVPNHKGPPLWQKIRKFNIRGDPCDFRMSQKLMTPLKMAENQKQKYFWEENYKRINDSDGTACLKGWFKIKISLLS